MSVRKRSSYSISFKLRAVEVAERVSKESGWCMEQSIHALYKKEYAHIVKVSTLAYYSIR